MWFTIFTSHSAKPRGAQSLFWSLFHTRGSAIGMTEQHFCHGSHIIIINGSGQKEKKEKPEAELASSWLRSLAVCCWCEAPWQAELPSLQRCRRSIGVGSARPLLWSYAALVVRCSAVREAEAEAEAVAQMCLRWTTVGVFMAHTLSSTLNSAHPESELPICWETPKRWSSDRQHDNSLSMTLSMRRNWAKRSSSRDPCLCFNNRTHTLQTYNAVPYIPKRTSACAPASPSACGSRGTVSRSTRGPCPPWRASAGCSRCGPPSSPRPPSAGHSAGRTSAPKGRQTDRHTHKHS